MRAGTLFVLLAACTGSVNQQIDFSKLDDKDQDGHPVETDCDDDNAAVHVDADEICDGLDNDCDGFIDAADEDAQGLLTGFIDADGDGYGDPDTEIIDCELPSGAVDNGEDCEDDNAEANPAGTETCSTTADDDCSGTVNDVGAEGCSDWFIDADGDGHGAGDPSCLCFGEGSYSSASSADCDDSDPETHPDAVEICDDGWDHDCDESAYACRLADQFEIEDAPLYLQGTTQDGLIGSRMAAASDLSGDGLDDLLLLGVSQRDLIWIAEGTGSGDEDLDSSPFVLEASSELPTIGHAFGGDLNDDGWADLIIGSPEAAEQAGVVAIFQGPLSGTAGLEQAWVHLVGELGAEAGIVAWSGSLMGAGSTSMAVAAPGEPAIYLLTAIEEGERELSEIGYRIEGTAQSLSTAGDIDGDGIDDLLVGDASSPDGGQVHIVLGPADLTSLEDAHALISAESTADLLGSSLSAAGDVNGDGLGDVIIGAPEHASEGTESGVAYLFHGPLEGTISATEAVARFDGAAAKDLAGTAICSPGDMDDDGFWEIAIGAPDNDEGASSAGMVGLFYGPVTGAHGVHRADAIFIGESEQDRAGQTLVGGMDLDGNGRPDLIIGVPGEDDAINDGGGAAIWTGLGY